MCSNIYTVKSKNNKNITLLAILKYDKIFELYIKLILDNIYHYLFLELLFHFFDIFRFNLSYIFKNLKIN